MKGTVVLEYVDSKVLRGNPLGDPHLRRVPVYLPPSYGRGDKRYPVIYLLAGFTGSGEMMQNRSPWSETFAERCDRLIARRKMVEAIVIMPDPFTRYGGSQFLNSAATGRYEDHVAKELVAYIDRGYRTIPAARSRAVMGKSSGGYGAMVVPMLRPDVYGALASHAGDALFEVCYQPEFPKVARLLRDKFEGSWEVFFEKFRAAKTLDFELHMDPLNSYAMGACYSPDEEEPGKALLPFDVATGRLNEDIWRRWLAWDPVRIAPEHGEALASMKRIYLDAGKSDEWYLDLGAQAFAKELDKLGVNYTLELFEGTHMGIQYRYPGAIAELAKALSPGA